MRSWLMAPRMRGPAMGSGERQATHDLQAIAVETRRDGLRAGQQPHLAHAQVDADLRADAVVAQDIAGVVRPGLAVALGEPVRVGIADEHRGRFTAAPAWTR